MGFPFLVFQALCLGGLNLACFVMLSTHYHLSSAKKVKVRLVVGNAISELLELLAPQIFYVDELDFIL